MKKCVSSWGTCAGLVAFACLSAGAAGMSGEPPSTRPADGAADGPVAAYAKYSEAAQAGDTAGMMALVHAQSDAEKQVAEVLVATDRTLAALAMLTREKFGAEAMVRQQHAIGDARPEDLKANIIGTGNARAANIVDKSDTPVTTMLLVDGKWKIYIKPNLEFWGGADKLITALKQAETVAAEYLAALKDGKYKTIDELIDAIKKG